MSLGPQKAISSIWSKLVPTAKEKQMRVQDIMTRAVVSATPQSSVLDLATLMLDNRVSAIPVISGCSLVGIVSEADLLHRYELGTQRDAVERPWWRRLFVDEDAPWSYVEAHAVRVRDLMSTPLVSVEDDASVGDVAALFETRNIRRAPVMKFGTMVGIVSRADFVRALVARAEVRRDQSPKSDEAIRRALLKELESHRWWRPDRSQVAVQDGIVQISGLFGSAQEQLAARVAAENITGVRGVEDARSLSVAPGGYL
jgi:CBS domain-containing protein